MSDAFDRRSFLKKAGALSAAAFTFEEQVLLGQRGQQPPAAAVAGAIPVGNLGRLKFTRLIAGHNLVVGQAHSRDLIYTSQLLRAYFTDDKILETFQKYEENGINASMLRVEPRTLGLIKRYKQERGGKLQWMAQLVISEADQTRDLESAAEIGAVAAHIRGLEGDRFFKTQRMDLIARTLENIRKAGMVAGLASHALDPLIEAERMGLNADYYMKTFNSAQYWSAPPPVPPDPNWKPTKEQLVQSEFGAATHDNIWETTPKATAEFFAKINKPFVAYKVCAAGAIHPRDGFKYAFDKGADFLVVGMYDFQLRDNANITKGLLAGKLDRTRPWCS